MSAAARPTGLRRAVAALVTTPSGFTPSGLLIAGIASGLAIMLTMMICEVLLPGTARPIILAPIGASTVLVLAVPSSPMASPRP